jgi:hypothetical protein
LLQHNLIFESSEISLHLQGFFAMLLSKNNLF